MIRSFFFSIIFFLGIIFISILFLPALMMPKSIVLFGGKLMGFWTEICLKKILSTEIIVKGKENILKDQKFFIKNKIKNNVVDTSGAGDGYNAAYISNFFKFNNPQKALHAASEIGAKIIMKKGAIINVK